MMAAEKWVSLLPILLLSLVLLACQMGDAATVPPTIFVFGDSLADVGTNNYLSGSTARADFPHNGIDFPGGIPTGRFSNGYNTIDSLAKSFGLSLSPPPYLSLTKANIDTQILKGVNFASAGSGLLKETGELWGDVVTFEKQTGRQFATVQGRLTKKLGSGATDMLASSLFIINVGGPDIAHRFRKFPNQTNAETQQLINTLISLYEKNLKLMYKLGARKFAIIGAAPLGCFPAVRSRNPDQGCADVLNDSIQTFNQATAALLKKVASELTGFKYSFGNTYDLISNVIKNSQGFKDVNGACCGSGILNGELPCLPSATYCDKRDEFLFWDLFHTTEAASKMVAKTLYSGPTKLVSPINFKQLVEDGSKGAGVKSIIPLSWRG